ncbi:MAG TPA: ester cyclase [Acidobacteriaceae bacterium]
MKKELSANRTASRKPSNDAVEAYIAAISEPTQSTLRQIREIIRSAVPTEAAEVISYGIPAFALSKPFFGYAAFKNHFAILPFSGSLFNSFSEELKPYTHTKSSLHLPFDKPLPATLIRKLVLARLAAIPHSKPPQAHSSSEGAGRGPHPNFRSRNVATKLSLEQMKQLVKDHFEDFVNKRNAGVIRTNMTPDFYDHDGPGGKPTGVEGDEEMMLRMYKAMPDLHLTIEDIIAEDDKVMCRNIWRWTDSSSGKKMQFHGFVLWRFEGDKIAERWATVTPPAEGTSWATTHAYDAAPVRA